MSDTTSKALTRRPASVSSGFYRAARRAAWVMVRTIIPVSYHYAERLDVDAPFIVIGNHLSLLDPIIVALPVKRYEIAFMGKKELGGNGLLKRILLNMHTIFVNRHHSDMEAMRAVMKAIREGEVLGIVLFVAFWVMGLIVINKVEIMKKQNDLVTYREIVAFSKGEDIEADEQAFSRRHPALSNGLKLSVSAISGFVVMYVVMKMFVG